VADKRPASPAQTRALAPSPVAEVNQGRGSSASRTDVVETAASSKITAGSRTQFISLDTFPDPLRHRHVRSNTAYDR
jgi:hypothetical protein